jgi:ankyrin repeat protein
MSASSSENPDLSDILARMAGSIDFQGMTPTSVNERGILGDTPLHLAAVSGDIRVGKILLDAGADPNIRGEYGDTPLHQAVGQKHYDFVKLLLTRGASKELRNDDGQTPVDLANMSNDMRLKESLC